MEEFIICVLTEMPEMLIDTESIKIKPFSEPCIYHKFIFRYVDGTLIETKAEVLEKYLKKNQIDYTVTIKKNRCLESYSILFEFNECTLKCIFYYFFK